MNLEYKKKLLLDKLFSLHRYGIKPGLERTEMLLESAGNPHRKIKTIHIAGTNGKGSVAALISSILTEAGYKTGLYTSPHIIDFNERIRIDGVIISDEDIIETSQIFLSKAEEINATFFEITTSIAFQYFFQNQTDIAIIETGMGGRFDSTNVINPLISIITNIGMDHKEFLGDTIEKIAFEKSGIIKKDVPVILGNIQEEILNIFYSKSDNIIKAKEYVQIENIQFLRDLKHLLDLKIGNVKYEFIKSGLAGYAQIENLLTAVTAIHQITDKFNISEQDIRNGLKNIKKNTGISSRIDLKDRNMPLIIDVAHNTEALHNLVKTIENSEYNNLKWNIVFAAMSDKDIKEMLEMLKPLINELIITKPKIDRAADTKNISEIAKKQNIRYIIIENPIDAYKFAKTENKPTIIVGSFYLIGDIAGEIK
jgi:dihydrofolate synthase/folylpolyglutamate synthase